MTEILSSHSYVLQGGTASPFSSTTCFPILLLVKANDHPTSTEYSGISRRHFLIDTLWDLAHTTDWNSPRGKHTVNMNKLKRILIILRTLSSPSFKDPKALRKYYVIKTPKIINDVNKHVCQLRQCLLINLFLVFGENIYN